MKKNVAIPSVYCFVVKIWELKSILCCYKKRKNGSFVLCCFLKLKKLT